MCFTYLQSHTNAKDKKNFIPLRRYAIEENDENAENRYEFLLSHRRRGPAVRHESDFLQEDRP